jgi:hypothetical protein
LQGWPFTEEERRQILIYCETDVDSLARLLPKMLPGIDLGVALYHGEFVAASTMMEHRGIPIDMEVFSQLTNPETWRALRDAMVPTIDAKYGVYVRDASGGWTFNMERFIAYLKCEGIPWPELETGKLNMQRKTFEELAGGVAALIDQARSGDGCRLYRLLIHGISDRSVTVQWPLRVGK